MGVRVCVGTNSRVGATTTIRSLTWLVHSLPTLLTRSSSLSMDILQPPPISQPRRRSVDVGGLSLALGSQGLGHGWVGWDESEIDTPDERLLYIPSFPPFFAEIP